MQFSQAATRVRLGLALRDKDPLSYWRFAVPRLRDFVALFSGTDPIDEGLGRAGNLGTKTETEVALMLSCAEKRQNLDGAPIPQWRGRVEGAQLVLDYKQQLLSVQPAYLRLLGQWPHHARYNGEYLSTLHIQPIGGDSDESTWSVIHFLSQENTRSGLGMRADIVAFDEPPKIEILHELRKAGHAGRRSIRTIWATPTIRRQWAPLKDEYGDPPRGSLTRTNDYWAECRWSLHEVADWVLSDQRKKALIDQYVGSDPDRPRDALARARIFGDYVDASGACPFDLFVLDQMLEKCRDPEIVNCKIQREVDTDEGRVLTINQVELRVWKRPAPGRSYYVPCDPSSGVNDSKHDPAALQVVEMGSGDVCAVFDGYIGSYGLGVLATIVARQYNNALIDPETTGGWGEGVLRGISESRYGNISKARKELQPGKFSVELGFKTTHESRGAMISAIQAWIDAWGRGVRYASCPSREIIQCLKDVILDETGKPVAAPGFHDEHLILRGQGLRRAALRLGTPAREAMPARLSRDERLVREIRGQDIDDEYAAPGGGRLMFPDRP